MMKLFINLLFICYLTLSEVYAFEYNSSNTGFKYVKHQHNESSYQHAWCSSHRGIEEYKNNDYTRVDCLTDTHAVEFDFANKWAESIGQAEHYAYKTGKKGMVVLILEDPKNEMIYYKRVENIGKIHGFDTEYVTPNILHIKDNVCPYKDCKCHRNRKNQSSE